MARSSAETEYQAIASTTSELIWIKQFLADMGIETQNMIKITTIKPQDISHQIPSSMSK
jgi:pyruvoyl-dependent arginine decarboxylase (PvlArgDC)